MCEDIYEYIAIYVENCNDINIRVEFGPKTLHNLFDEEAEKLIVQIFKPLHNSSQKPVKWKVTNTVPSHVKTILETTWNHFICLGI